MDNDIKQIADEIQQIVNSTSKESYGDGWSDAILTIAEDINDPELKAEILKHRDEGRR